MHALQTFIVLSGMFVFMRRQHFQSRELMAFLWAMQQAGHPLVGETIVQSHGSPHSEEVYRILQDMQDGVFMHHDHAPTPEVVCRFTRGGPELRMGLLREHDVLPQYEEAFRTLSEAFDKFLAQEDAP